MEQRKKLPLHEPDMTHCKMNATIAKLWRVRGLYCTVQVIKSKALSIPFKVVKRTSKKRDTGQAPGAL
jgi:hypothetical protein